MLTDRQAEARRSRIGASEVAALFDAHPFVKRTDIYDRIIHGQGREVNERMRVGQMLEPVVLDLLRDLRGIHSRACWRPYVHRILPICASPDAYALDGHGLVEVKVTSAWGDLRHGGVPDYVYWQVECQMWLARRDYCYIAALAGSNLMVTRIEAEPEAHERIAEAVGDFWRNHLSPRIRPTEAVFTLGASK
jgi:predicted phage-related endonuclease